uniref:3-oxo-5-alpha-steroid 4-dehydrogenase C-terminal domain-containing protein n=1 Tax=Callorhinchus milii TaxID=7868 RepID=A0A4W3GYN4_CALMI
MACFHVAHYSLINVPSLQITLTFVSLCFPPSLACICHSIHYAKQLLETLFVHNFSNGNTALKNMLKGCVFYWGFTTWMSSSRCERHYIKMLGLLHLPMPIFYLLCLLLGSGIHFARATYNPFTWLFKLVSCPNYTYEVINYFNMWSQERLPWIAVFALMISLQLSLWAQRKHFKYRKHFKNYPVYRAAIIPFIL